MENANITIEENDQINNNKTIQNEPEVLII